MSIVNLDKLELWKYSHTLSEKYGKKEAICDLCHKEIEADLINEFHNVSGNTIIRKLLNHTYVSTDHIYICIHCINMIPPGYFGCNCADK
jgi:hypothetical protein